MSVDTMSMGYQTASLTAEGLPLGGEIGALVQRARAGDDSADYVARMVRDPVEAEDVAQEAFVRAYLALPTFRGEASFQTWLYRIASNLAIDASRHRQRRQWQTTSLDEPIDTHGSDSQLLRDPADEITRPTADTVEAGVVQEQVWGAISELSDKLRRRLPAEFLSDWGLVEARVA